MAAEAGASRRGPDADPSAMRFTGATSHRAKRGPVHTQHRRSLLVAIALLAAVAAVAPTAGVGATPAAPRGSGRSALRATPLRATGRRSVAKSRTSRSARSDADLLARGVGDQ